MISRIIGSKLSARIAVLIVVEIVLIAGSFAYVASFENSNALFGNSINIAGKNRFLTATVLLESEYYLSDHARQANLEDSLNSLESNILLLKEGGKVADIEVGPLPYNFLDEWQVVYDNWVMLKAETEQLISSNSPAGEILTSSELKARGNNLITSSDLLVTDMGDYSKRISNNLVTLQIGLGILNIGVHLVMLYLIVRILKPIKVLTQAMRSVREGDLTISLAQKGNDELQRLTESFNSMVVSLRQSTHMLAMERQRYREMYDGAPDLYRMTNRKGIVLDCNDSYVRNLGYSDKNELIGKSIFETTADSSLNAMREAFETWRRRGIIENVEIWLKRKDGSSFPTLISATAAAVYHGNREIVASNTCIIDVTEMYKAKEELEEANKRLAEVNRMKTDFIRIAAHELRTPIQPILGYSELGLKGVVSSKEAFEAINQQARRLQHLANDILDITTITGGTMGLELEECPIDDILRIAVQQTEHLIHKDVKVELELDPKTDETSVLADRHRIVQLITNILSNATKFTNKGAIIVATKVVDDGRFVEICVSDTGSGIPEEVLPSLFTIFSAKSVNAGAEHGTGFGLFISKGIVEAHGGSIVGYNNPTGGATFKLRLPADKNSLKNQDKVQEKTGQNSAPSRSETQA